MQIESLKKEFEKFVGRDVPYTMYESDSSYNPHMPMHIDLTPDETDSAKKRYLIFGLTDKEHPTLTEIEALANKLDVTVELRVREMPDVANCFGHGASTLGLIASHDGKDKWSIKGFFS